LIEAKKLLWRGAGDDAAGFKEDDAGSEKEGLPKIVGNENDGLAKAAGKGGEFALQFGTRDRIEGAKRFVHKKDGRIGGEGTGDTDALALATGKLTGATAGKFSGIKPYQIQELAHTGRGPATVPFFEGEEERDVFGNGEVRKESRILNNIANATTETDGIPVRRRAIVDTNFPRSRNQNAVDKAEEGGLAAAAATEEDEGLTMRNC
jgi:hypothetical protein